jgi:hypothetical protein
MGAKNVLLGNERIRDQIRDYAGTLAGSNRSNNSLEHFIELSQ